MFSLSKTPWEGWRRKLAIVNIETIGKRSCGTLGRWLRSKWAVLVVFVRNIGKFQSGRHFQKSGRKLTIETVVKDAIYLEEHMDTLA